MAIGISDLFDMAARGDMGRMFLSGVQVDRHGNLNVTAIGDPDTTVQDVLDNTEFEPVIAPDVSLVPLPAPEHVALIRRFDPLRTHQREFKSTDLSRCFDL